MPKLKTHKATAKRIKVTGRKKLRHIPHMRGHNRRKKSKEHLRSLDKDQPLDKSNSKRIRRLLGLKQRK